MSSILDPGKGSRKKAKQMAQQAPIGNLFADTPLGGISFSNGSLNMGGNEYYDQILGQLGSLLGSGNDGLAGLIGAGQQAMSGLGPINLTGADAELLANLKSTALDQFNTLGMTPAEIGAQKTSLLDQLAAPKEALARNNLTDNLFATGRLGSTGGQLENQSLLEAQNTAALQRQLAGMEYGRSVQADALSRLGSTIGLGEQLTQGQFARDLGLAGANAQRTLSRFGIAGSLFDAQNQAPMNLFSQLGALQGLQLNPFQAALQAAIGQSNSYLGASNALAGIASSTPSPFLDLATGVLGAAGGAGGFGNLFG